MTTAFLGLGSNLGERSRTLLEAVDLLHGPEVRVHRLSDCYRSEPLGLREQPEFLNAVCRLECRLGPRQLLERCLEIERSLGRSRRVRWGPRTIDLDILYFGRLRLSEEALTIPHPHLHERRFVLMPLVEISPGWQDPARGLTARRLLQACPDTSAVQPALGAGRHRRGGGR